MVEEQSTAEADMTYIVSLSGGTGSAMAAERALQRYGKQVRLWFSDVRHEDEDLYRFMQDTARRWWQIYGVRLYIHRNSRNPLVVAEQKVIIPNERRAPCSHELKIVPFRRYIAELPKPITVMLGMDWKEQHRLDAPRKAYEALGYQVDYPLMWKPWELRPYQDVIREEWGIEPPRLYAMGFPHNNCFAGETRFLTSEGTRRLDEMVGTTTQVLTSGGVWTSAEIKSFGVQPLLALRISRATRRTREKTIYTTAEHRWLVYQDDWSNQQHELLTSQLMPGMELVSTFEGGAEPGCWTVEACEPTERVEEVYCAVVPGTHCFVLEDNILTGNCGGRCIKQGVREWLRLRYHFPERFEAMKQWELAQRAKGGARATHAICSEERNKVRYPLTLEEIERRLLAGHYDKQMQEIINKSEYKDDRVHCYCAYA